MTPSVTLFVKGTIENTVGCDLQEELLLVVAGVVHVWGALHHVHVELGHSLLQVLVQLSHLSVTDGRGQRSGVTWRYIANTCLAETGG